MLAPRSSPTSSDALDEAIGQTLGRYKLLEKVGEGGRGMVYVAEQKEPVRRKLALKVIKLGMDAKRVVARFEAERQALAMMDHPNTAKVLDAGTTLGAPASRWLWSWGWDSQRRRWCASGPRGHRDDLHRQPVQRWQYGCNSTSARIVLRTEAAGNLDQELKEAIVAMKQADTGLAGFFDSATGFSQTGEARQWAGNADARRQTPESLA